ncbi:DNA polymerase IV [Salinispirillum sp. LH 10-3-1]|uniref:DNA polymerase IV n=1 Tax=Salinispirillum sp. LH 10-3-1 TaxID=2952525 RepID=A0AB38YB83_9GAMM
MNGPQRKIIHVDMDCFFAAVEMRDRPELRTLPIAIAGSVHRGVVATCNYPARQFGVKSAMATAHALKLCPQLVLVPGNMEKYRQASQHIRSIMERYATAIEPLSMDEAYLDVTGSELFSGSATRIAEHLRQTIFEETGLTASAGVAPNKFLAKIASDENKPDGLYVIAPEHVSAFVRNLPLRKLPGIGKKGAERLESLGLYLCSDVQEAPLDFLVRHCGSMTEQLLKRSQGIDNRPVQTSRERKSVGVERTLMEDLSSQESCLAKAMELWPRLQDRLVNAGAERYVRSISVKLKFNDFLLTTAEKRCQDISADDIRELVAQGWQRGHGKPVRLVGLQAGLLNQSSRQLELPFDG